MQSSALSIDIGELLRRILVSGKRRSLLDIAAALQISVRQLGSKIRNGGRFSPAEIVILLRVIGEERLLREWFFTGTSIVLVRRPLPSPDGGPMTLAQRALACAVEAIGTVDGMTDALEMSERGERHSAVIEPCLNRVESGLWSIKLHLALPPHASETTTQTLSHNSFAALVTQVLMREQRIRPQRLAATLGLNYAALRSRLKGDVPFLPAELRQIFRMFPDPRLADYLLAGTPYMAILRPAITEARLDDSPLRTGLLVLRKVVTFLQELLRAEDMPIPRLHATVTGHLDEAVRLVAMLRWNMTHIGHSVVPRPDVAFEETPARGALSGPY